MPDHVFLAAFEEHQLECNEGLAWLKLLKEHGFEFIRTVNNSVYNSYLDENRDDEDKDGWSHPVHIFGLFRNVSPAKIKDPRTPPQVWQDLPEPSMSQAEMWHEVVKHQTHMPVEKNSKAASPARALAFE